MKKLLLLLFVIAFSHSITKAQCPPGAFAYQSLYPQCASGCGVLLLGWPEGVIVNIYGGTPLTIITTALISGTLGGGGTGDAFTCVPCNTPLIYASTILNATGGCVIATIGIVPIKLTNFSASSLADNSCILKWTASQETGGVKYVVQRSGDGRNFNDIKTLASYTNGNPSNTYSYKDVDQVEGYNYYRLKMIEVTGNITFSPVASVKNEKTFEFSIYPNPVFNNFSVLIADKLLPATVEIYNAQGQSVYRFKTSQHLSNVDTQLEKGIYALKVTGSNNLSTTQKLIKQ
jgi:hypothetical protein